MKRAILLFLFSTLTGLFFTSNSVYGQEPLPISLNPVKPGGLSGGTVGSRSEESLNCPLSLSYNQSTDLIEFENLESSAISFAYYIYDADEDTVCYDTICINGNTSHQLYLNSIEGETYRIQIELEGIIYEGHFGL